MKNKKLLVDYYNTDIEKNVLGMFESDDFRLTEYANTYRQIGELVKISKKKELAPNGYLADIYSCNGEKFYVFPDWSVSLKESVNNK